MCAPPAIRRVSAEANSPRLGQRARRGHTAGGMSARPAWSRRGLLGAPARHPSTAR
jgi:hypothetical protein